MGSPSKPRAIRPPPSPADTMKAQLNALAYAEMERKIRRTSGYQGTFTATRKQASTSLLGM